MEMFGKFKKKDNGLENENNEEWETSDWNAITKAFEELYPGQDNPKHYGTLIK